MHFSHIHTKHKRLMTPSAFRSPLLALTSLLLYLYICEKYFCPVTFIPYIGTRIALSVDFVSDDRE